MAYLGQKKVGQQKEKNGNRFIFLDATASQYRSMLGNENLKFFVANDCIGG